MFFFLRNIIRVRNHLYSHIIITRYDTDNDGYLDIEDLKGMMMVRGVPWTHSAIVRLIRDADEDGDGKLSFREVSGFFYTLLNT